MNNDSMGSTQPLTSIPTQRFCIRHLSPGQCGGSSPQRVRVGRLFFGGGGLIAVEEEALGSDLAERWKAWKSWKQYCIPTADLE